MDSFDELMQPIRAVLRDLHRRGVECDPWIDSPEYMEECQHMRDKADELLSIAETYRAKFNRLWEDCLAKTAYKEYASGIDLHRGYYCPSPIYDVVVGNVKRGKLLKRFTSRTKIYLEYFFNQDGTLLGTSQHYNGNSGLYECLIYLPNEVIGITCYADGRMDRISQEVYENDKLVQYWNLPIHDFSSGMTYSHLMVEEYFYDEYGLSRCKRSEYMREAVTEIQIWEKYLYIFERENDYLKGYYAFRRRYEDEPIVLDSERYYPITIERKA